MSEVPAAARAAALGRAREEASRLKPMAPKDAICFQTRGNPGACIGYARLGYVDAAIINSTAARLQSRDRVALERDALLVGSDQ